MKHKFSIILLLVLFIIIFSAKLALAGSATVSWNANTESDLLGYKIYYGTSPRTGTNPGSGANSPLPKCGLCGYSASIDVGKVTTYTFNNLTNGQTYYFSVSAYDTSYNESAFSAEVQKTIPSGLTADLNLDSHVNSVDFGIMMSFWGSTNKPSADINKDSAVNSVDFGILMSQWTG